MDGYMSGINKAAEIMMYAPIRPPFPQKEKDQRRA